MEELEQNKIMEELEQNIINFNDECNRIAYHIEERIKERNNFCIPYLECFIPDDMRTDNEFLSDIYIINNIFPKLAEYLNATIESLNENQCTMKYFNYIIEMKYTTWFSRDGYDIEISGKIIN